MDKFTKWQQEIYTNSSQEASTVTEVLVANFFCHFGVQRELQNNQHRNYGS
jgi:hypothetical protein